MDLKTIKRPLKLVVGSVMFVVGIITAPFPLPIGQFVALIGLSLLVSESHWLKTKMQKLRRRLPLIGRQFLKKVIDDTDPVHLAE